MAIQDFNRPKLTIPVKQGHVVYVGIVEPQTEAEILEQHDWFVEVFGDEGGDAYLDRLALAAESRGIIDEQGRLTALGRRRRAAAQGAAR